MRNSSKLDEASKCKDDQQQVSLITSVKEIRRVADINQMRLQQLELAVANLTTICSAIRHDMYTLNSASNQGSLNKVQAEVVEMKRPSYTRSSSSDKDDVLGLQMQQLVKQAAALGILKDSDASPIPGNEKANSKIQTRLSPKKMQTTPNKKSSTKQPIRRLESTTKRKTSMKLATVNKNMGASSAGSNKASASAKVSLKSTVKRTKTTISKVYVDQPTQKQGKDTVVKNVQQKEDKSSIKLTVKAHQGNNKSQSSSSSKSHSPTKTNSSPGAVKSDIKPRRKWNTPEDIMLKR
ncbi:uncharacterized protein LOC110684134 [Chenopodium quinoa]|uniref:Uncharacterized protein n=1 Tax=Chenopodium quinoa TaxID=63459 RepID=A0A803LCQ2_CHEQI|nr:uncharacterized protein LOC110684134 [Chenopodium quinoa]